MRSGGLRWPSLQPEWSIACRRRKSITRLAGSDASGGASCSDRFLRARIPDARAADGSHHSGRERRAWCAGGRRARVDRHAGRGERPVEADLHDGSRLDRRRRPGSVRRPTSCPLPLRSRPRCSMQIAYRRNETPELEPGIRFFTWVRRMTVDAFYTSEIGIRDIDYRGNTALGAYPEPTEAIAFALKKSGLHEERGTGDALRARWPSAHAHAGGSQPLPYRRDRAKRDRFGLASSWCSPSCLATEASRSVRRARLRSRHPAFKARRRKLAGARRHRSRHGAGNIRREHQRRQRARRSNDLPARRGAANVPDAGR